MRIFHKISEIKSEIKNLKKQGKKIAFVPTMGFLHEGHLSLIDEAKKNADIVISSIFVNQKQFNEASDFTNYPSNLEGDIAKLESKKTDILFCPNSSEIYPRPNLINFEIKNLADNLCGATRQNHFQGVVLVVSKLFNIIDPDVAIFGEKDFQQLQIIRRLVSDLNFDIKIIPGAIFREENGLAMSSRNSRLTSDNLNKSPEIYKILSAAKTEILSSKTDKIHEILEKAKIKLSKIFDKIDYLEICDEENLQIVKEFDKNIKSRIFVAVYAGEIRLIDNIPLY